MSEAISEPKKRPVTPCPWASVPPQTIPERLQAAADLEKLIGTPSVNYEIFSKTLAISCYALSGPEMMRVSKGLVKLLRGEV